MTGKEKPQGGIMIPIPQYPLYTATIAEYNAYAVSALTLFVESLVLWRYIVEVTFEDCKWNLSSFSAMLWRSRTWAECLSDSED